MAEEAIDVKWPQLRVVWQSLMVVVEGQPLVDLCLPSLSRLS